MFSDVNLKKSEKFKLFCMRFKKKVTEKFLGKDKDYPLSIDFIAPNYVEQRNNIGERLPNGTYSLTEKYTRYCIHCKNNRFYAMLNSVVFPIIVSIVASVITSVITVLVLQELGLQ